MSRILHGAILIFFLVYISPVQAQVQINEILPDPIEGEEAIELSLSPAYENEAPFLLAGWSLWDELNTPSLLHQFETEQLATGEYLVIYCHNKLNNNKDGLVLKDNWGEERDHFSYTETQKGLSYSRINANESSFLVTPPTIGSINLIPTLTPSPTPTVFLTATPTPFLTLISTTPSFYPSPSTSTTPTPTSSAFLLTPTPQLSPIPLASSSATSQSSTKSSTSSDQSTSPSPALLLIDQERLLQDIRAFKLEQSKTFYLMNKSSKPNQRPQTTLFSTTLAFEQPVFSEEKLLSVIIGGWFLIIASRLIYETESIS